ncbi:hypothetical protein BHM03_00045732 [Ensete ventricosum]|nr:hypothetical protein BHM03_00045732 [Ensete ventricosum]
MAAKSSDCSEEQRRPATAVMAAKKSDNSDDSDGGARLKRLTPELWRAPRRCFFEVHRLMIERGAALRRVPERLLQSLITSVII